MFKSMKRGLAKLHTEDGFAVVLALLIMLIMSVLGLTLLTATAYQWMDTDRTKPSNRAFDLADCGLSWAHVYISRDPTIPEIGYNSGDREMGAPDSKFNVNIKDLGNYKYKITSTGTYTAKQGSGTRDYNRTLQEVVRFRGVKGHFDAFTYTLFSRDGDVSMNTGQWAVASGNGVTIEGNGGHAIYAGGNVTLEDTKAFLAGAKLTVNGDVYAGGNVSVATRSALGTSANVNVTGDVIAGGNVDVSSACGGAAGATTQVTGSINAKGNVNLSSWGIFFVVSSTKVAQSPGKVVNAGGNVTIKSEVGAIAGAETYVGNSGAPSSVNAVGNSSVYAACVFLAVSKARVYGDLKNNGTAKLEGYGLGDVQGRVDGLWQHGIEPHVKEGASSYGTHSSTNPNIQAANIESIPDVEFPVPDWGWYKTMAVAQNNYWDGDKTFTNITIPDDPSSMWVLYVAGNVTINNLFFSVDKRGVIVSEGNVNVTNSVQLRGHSEYQVIAKGDVGHKSFFTLNPSAEDKVFLYTDGSYDANNNGNRDDDGNVSYDLGYFRDIKGQITCKGNITAPVANFLSFDQHKITYASPCVPAEGWPIPFEVITFKEIDL